LRWKATAAARFGLLRRSELTTRSAAIAHHELGLGAIVLRVPPDQLDVPRHVVEREVQKLVLDHVHRGSHVDRGDVLGVVEQGQTTPANPDRERAQARPRHAAQRRREAAVEPPLLQQVNDELGYCQFHDACPILVAMVIDQFHDPVLGTLVKIASDRPRLASAVMSFDVDPSESERLPDHAFAWPEKRAYPVHSREHAMLSRAYRDGVGGRVPAHVDATIKEALDVYGVDEAVFAQTKVASAPPVDDASDYLLPDIRRLRVTESGHVKAAADRLIQQGDRLSPGHRVLAGSRLVEKAAFFGVRVGDEVRRMAGLVATSTPVLADWLEARGQATSAEFRDGYDKLASEVRRMPDELSTAGSRPGSPPRSRSWTSCPASTASGAGGSRIRTRRCSTRRRSPVRG
jgi:hypothetical protein